MNKAIRLTLLATLVAASGMAQAQNRVVRMVVPFAAGGPADYVARVLSEKLGTQLGSQVVLDNRPGANGAIAAQQVAKSAPDGTTLMFVTSGMLTISPSLYKDLAYDPARDFAPVSRAVANGTALVVSPGLPANNIRELVALGKSRKEPLTMGSAGTGNITHLYVELLKESTKADITHVPYKGIAPALTDVLGGQITGVFADFPVSLPQIKAGKVKALGIVGATRSAAAPEIPTIAEQGFPGVDGVSWFGVVAPAKTPHDVVMRINEGIAKALADPELKKKLQDGGSEPAPNSPEDMKKQIESERVKWATIITQRKITAD